MINIVLHRGNVDVTQNQLHALLLFRDLVHYSTTNHRFEGYHGITIEDVDIALLIYGTPIPSSNIYRT